MNLFLKGITIADPNSKFNGKITNIRVTNGEISAIGADLLPNPGEDAPDVEGAVLSPGFFDLNCMGGDPGLETKEDLDTLCEAAQAGGFTGLAVLPQTKPVIQSKAQIDYILHKTRAKLVNVYPIGAVSNDLAGKELAEIFDMKNAGAIAFSDGDAAIQDDGFMSRALQYAQGIDALLMVFPENKSMAGKSQIHESRQSILLGMKGIPAIAEEMQIARDIFLAAYHQAPLHISTISTADSVALIKKAKKEGLKISCDIAAHQLLFTEEVLDDFDSNYKVKPPFRSKADQKALLNGLKEGIIDAVSSQHRPHEVEFKNVEFEHAAFGMMTLQTVLPVLLQAGLQPELIAEKLAVNPRKVLGLHVPVIEPGEKADFVLYLPQKSWELNAQTNASKSANSPFMGKELKGKVILTANNRQYKKYE